MVVLTAATVCTARACRHKTSRRDAMARDPRRDLLGQDRDILLWDQDETHPKHIGPRPRRWGFCPRPSRDRDHIPVKISIQGKKLTKLYKFHTLCTQTTLYLRCH